MSLGAHVNRVIVTESAWTPVRGWEHKQRVFIKTGFKEYFSTVVLQKTEINVVACAAAQLFDLGEERPFVVVRVFIVVPGNRVESWAFCQALSNDVVRHAYDGRGVHTTTQFSEDRTIGSKAPLNGFGENDPEMLFVFRIRSVPNPFGGIEVPVLGHGLDQLLFRKPDFYQ